MTSTTFRRIDEGSYSFSVDGVDGTVTSVWYRVGGQQWEASANGVTARHATRKGAVEALRRKVVLAR